MPELYDRIGVGYRALRVPDPRIAAALDHALGDAASVANIGAGAGSYEPRNRQLLCRCGHSANKPFCDGSHARVGFRARE